jgi:hypothetical protein
MDVIHVLSSSSAASPRLPDAAVGEPAPQSTSSDDVPADGPADGRTPDLD